MAFSIDMICVLTCCIIAKFGRGPGVPVPCGVPWSAAGVLSVCCSDCQRGRSCVASCAVTALDVPSSFNIPAASCNADGPLAGVPLICVALDELEEFVFTSADPLTELDEDALAEAPQAVITTASMHKVEINIMFFNRSP